VQNAQSACTKRERGKEREIEERCFSDNLWKQYARAMNSIFQFTILITSQQIDDVALVYGINHRFVEYRFPHLPYKHF
jgi:hypothetical protein